MTLPPGKEPLLLPSPKQLWPAQHPTPSPPHLVVGDADPAALPTQQTKTHTLPHTSLLVTRTSSSVMRNSSDGTAPGGYLLSSAFCEIGAWGQQGKAGRQTILGVARATGNEGVSVKPPTPNPTTKLPLTCTSSSTKWLSRLYSSWLRRCRARPILAFWT